MVLALVNSQLTLDCATFIDKSLKISLLPLPPSALQATDAVFVLDLVQGLWSSRLGITITAFMAMLSNAVASSVGITQRQSQFLPSPCEVQTGFFSSLLLLHTPCPPAMIESPHQYLPIQSWMQSRCRIAGDRQVS